MLTTSQDQPSTAFVGGYTVRITGPGMDSTIAIKDIDNVDIMLKMVRRLLAEKDPLLS